MYRTKKDVDKHVENLISKLSVKEFKTRAYSVARLYFEVGDYASCQRYVEQYITQKDNNAAAHKLLGQALQKLGQKEKALEQYKFSLDIDPTQTSTILEICELLTDDEIAIDPGRAKYWYEKAEATFPRHPVTFRLRERLVTMANPDPEALAKLLKAELAVRPKDAVLHCRLLKHYMQTNQIKEAFNHSCSVEFGNHTFINNYTWYDTLTEILKHNSLSTNDWLYQLLLLTVRERICVLSLTETPSGLSKSLIESSELLHSYDQAIEKVAKAGASSGFGEFHAALLQHHRGQFVFHAATYLLKKAKKDQLSWRDVTRTAATLMLVAWQTVPLDSKVNWLLHAPEKQQVAVHRWYTEGSYRCSQSGHYLLANVQDKSQSFLDKIAQACSGGNWREKLYEKIFTSKDQLSKSKSSHFVSEAYVTPVLRLPRRIEVEAYDVDAQREYPNSLHHFVWTLLNYKNHAHFKCTLFDMLRPTASNCGPETLNKLDVHAFLYFAALTSRQRKNCEVSYITSDKPTVLPANITDLLCSLPQMKWWDCAYKFSQNELGTELTDIRATLSRGIEVVRCIDNHGLDPELLCIVGGIFSERAKLTTAVDERNKLEIRAGLYYSSALPLLEKLKCKIVLKMPEKRLFDYTHKELGSKELNSLIEESKLYVAVNYLNDCEYDKVIELLSNLKSPEAFYHLSQVYKKLALEENNLTRDSIDTKSKYVTLIMKAKNFAYKALDRVKDTELNKNHPLYSEVQQLIEELETQINKIDLDLSGNNDVEGKYSSDENISSAGSEHVPMRNNHMIRTLCSTPKQPSNPNLTNYRTAVDSQLLETTRIDPQFFDKIENQIKTFQKRLADDFMEQTKGWFEENRRLGNQIMNTIQNDIQNTTDQFKLLKISVDQVKDQIDECRNECKDVGDLKKQIAELKKEVNKLKKASSEQTINESDLYNLDDDYRTNESASSFTAQLPFQAPQVMPSFNQRLVPPFPVPPNPYQLYNQNLYNLYNQYSQFSQASSVPGAPPLFDPTKLNYPSVYPTADQMYLDVAHLVPPSVPAPPSVPPVPTMPLPPVSTVSTGAALPTATSIAIAKPAPSAETKDTSRPLPVNVVITSSDPLPTCTTTPAPILSVTIPPKHIKGTPHNYQIPMPSTNDTNVASPPVFSFPGSANRTSTTASSVVNWGNSNIFKTSQSGATGIFNTSGMGDTLDKSVVDGTFTGASPNTSLNKSRTLSERSNTSIENYDPCPDFKPIIPLPAEVKVTTGEEDETAIFCARAKLFRFVDKQWKERGIGEMKLLKHKVTGKVRVLMRREQIHKICANHVITADMEIKPMKNETKAYFWVANDFADETVVLEKFCIRFKTADIAQQFYQAFENARKVATSTSTPKKEESVKKIETSIKSNQPVITPAKGKPSFVVTSQPTKTEFGGFTFSSTPTIKPVENDTKTDIKPSEPTTTKVNIFSSLNFKTTTSSPFSNLFSATSSPQTSTSQIQTNTNNVTPKQETPNKLSTSDIVEEFEPNVEFKPVVPLPALVDQKTGEEEENIVFEHRAKLLRFDTASKEWKERGLGNIKLLIHKDNVQKVRLLMRREQIMKVCCNHAITKDMTFQKMPNMDKAVTWCAKDFSEGELVAETFCLRFKTVKACDDFIQAVKSVQSKIKDDSKAAKEEQNAAKQNNQIGFGDAFKPKAGSWQCDVCYTNNLENFLKCACCEQPKPQSNENDSAQTSSAPAAGWGDKFKPKAGSWECSMCLIRNDAAVDYCTACDNPKDPNMPKKESKLVSDSAPKFSFGIPAQTTNMAKQDQIATPAAPAPASAAPGWGDKFKPKEGTWECKECFVRNEGGADKCSACTSPRDPSANNNQGSSVFVNVTAGPKFSFGIPPASNVEQKPTTETTSIFDGTGSRKFRFGISTNTQSQTPNVVSFGSQKPSIFGTVTPKANEGPVNLSTNKNEAESDQTTPVKSALLPTPTEGTPFGDKDSHATFEFVFKPKTPPKGKSPMKTPKAEGDESDDNEYASEDEGHHIHFSPVIPLPDKVDVVTGEENETELYGHRAKLFRFTAGEWKERGIGIVKILKHNDTGKLRVLMRREQVLKICLNHVLSPEITYTPKDDKTWLFAANDYSEGELSLQQFCLRFKTKEIASEFKDAIEKARGGRPLVKRDVESDTKDTDSDDVVFVNEILASPEDKQRARDLMLPENFYTYKNKDPCKGCRGCKEDDDKGSKSETTKNATSINTTGINMSAPFTSSTLTTPLKSSISSFQSPMTSFYGTPSNLDKTVDASIFRTPLGSLGSNTNSASPATPTNITPRKDTTNKENTLTPKNIFEESQQSNIFTTPQNKPANIFGCGEAQNSISSKSSTLAAPKLNTITTSGGENQTVDAKTIFGAAQVKSVFGENNSIFGSTNAGLSTNKSIFGFAADSKKDDGPKSEVTSVFGGEEQKPVNLFSGASQGSIFGPGALGTQQKSSGLFGTFGSNTTQPSQIFGTGKSIFGGSNQTPTWTFGAASEQKKPDLAPVTAPKEESKPQSEAVVADTPFKVDNSLTFAALSSSSGSTFTAQKKSDFQWEGAGQQLFTTAQRAAAKEEQVKGDAADESGAGADEEYDPHYEPIVPLPDKIVVTTGEEDEEKLYGERCKLYRYDDKTREWKERGVGEMKILYHPEKKTYRLLLRREQVHKAVLNMLIFSDMELLPMKNSDRAWTWAGRNFAENPQGEQETLAVRFKSIDLAITFQQKIIECTQKLQTVAAQPVREEKPADPVTPLRLPKHLESSARADLNNKTEEQTQSKGIQRQGSAGSNGEVSKNADVFKQVQFQEPEEDPGEEYAEEEEYDYDHNEDYDAYYNDEEEESAAYYECVGEAVVTQGATHSTCDNAHIQVLFDQEICSPKILVTDSDTGEILADLLIHTDTEFQINGNSCTWSGTDYTSNSAVDKTVTINFHDSDTAMQFYDSCETSKGATYSSTDPES
ncbi:E3 SUMO-protein ligase RanBP2-like [Pectinophora gossypiella]|uniref:E3 SUMO-protein ligase RanBP2-like n=1 Tax=Pectinophora gossypiella TaxID=13191 RepID=UPI00214E1484|nr:E3 SUMO-protein ligase RanBP2-like [Pectinophora gossypiella]